MFKVNAKPLFKHTVTVDCILAGKPSKQSMDVTYRGLSDAELAAFGEDIEGVKGRLRATVESIDGLVDDKDVPVPFTSDVFEQMITQQWCRAALAQGYFAAMIEARTGN
jgi:hypothetical protein